MSNNPYGMSWFTRKLALITGGAAEMGRTAARQRAAEAAADRGGEV